MNSWFGDLCVNSRKINLNSVFYNIQKITNRSHGDSKHTIWGKLQSWLENINYFSFQGKLLFGRKLSWLTALVTRVKNERSVRIRQNPGFSAGMITAQSISDYGAWDLEQETILHYRCSHKLPIYPTGDYYETTLYLSESNHNLHVLPGKPNF